MTSKKPLLMQRIYNFVCILKNHKMINIKIDAETSEPQSIETISFAEPGTKGT